MRINSPRYAHLKLWDLPEITSVLMKHKEAFASALAEYSRSHCLMHWEAGSEVFAYYQELSAGAPILEISVSHEPDLEPYAMIGYRPLYMTGTEE